MRDLKSLIKYYLIPPGVANGISGIKSFFLRKRNDLSSKFPREILKKNHVLNNAFYGHPGYLLGTGPSIQKQDLSRLPYGIRLSLNAFYNHPQISELEIDFHMYSCFQWHPGMPNSEKDIAIEQIGSRFPSKTNLIFCAADYHKIILNPCMAGREIYFIDWCRDLTKCSFDELDLVDNCANGRNVAVVGLFLLMKFGCNPIYLLGVDFDWVRTLFDPDYLQHFFTKKRNSLDCQNTDHDAWSGSTELLWYEYYRNWTQFNALASVAKEKNIDIFNATPGSLLDMFPRASHFLDRSTPNC
jgi:hypothetical protein